MKPIGMILSAFLLVLLSLFGYSWYRLYTMLHLHANSDVREFPPGISPMTEFVITSDGVRIAYWYVPVPDSKAVVILVHGYSNPGGKAQMLGVAQFLNAAGYSTVLPDLRSFGESDGDKISLGTQEWKDVEAVYDHMRSLPENQSTKIGYLGISMGATTSLVTAGRTGKGDFVIASVPFKDIDSLYHFQIQANELPTEIFHPLIKIAGLIELGTQYRQSIPSSLIQDIQVPVFLIGATKDQEVHTQDAKDLYVLANDPKEYWLADSPHDVFYFRTDEFTQRVLAFLEKYSK